MPENKTNMHNSLRILENLEKNELVNHFIVVEGEIYIAFHEVFVNIFLVIFVEKMMFLGIFEQNFHIINR